MSAGTLRFGGGYPEVPACPLSDLLGQQAAPASLQRLRPRPGSLHRGAADARQGWGLLRQDLFLGHMLAKVGFFGFFVGQGGNGILERLQWTAEPPRASLCHMLAAIKDGGRLLSCGALSRSWRESQASTPLQAVARGRASCGCTHMV